MFDAFSIINMEIRPLKVLYFLGCYSHPYIKQNGIWDKGKLLFEHNNVLNFQNYFT